MQYFTGLLISHRSMWLRNSIGRLWTTVWIDHHIRSIRGKASAVKNCGNWSDKGREKPTRIRQVSGQGRNRERATENGEVQSPLNFEVGLCIRGAITSGSIYFFLLSFSVPLLIHTYVLYLRYIRARYSPISSSSRFLLYTWILRECLAKLICPILIQYYLMYTF